MMQGLQRRRPSAKKIKKKADKEKETKRKGFDCSV